MIIVNFTKYDKEIAINMDNVDYIDLTEDNNFEFYMASGKKIVVTINSTFKTFVDKLDTALKEGKNYTEIPCSGIKV